MMTNAISSRNINRFSAADGLARKIRDARIKRYTIAKRPNQANIIERPFTIDRSMEGPDHILSSEPKEMGELVDAAKQIPKIIGDGIKRIQPNEYITLNTQRKSLYAASSIKKGEIISENKIVIKGPGGGLLPKFLDIVIGREAKNNIDEDSPINWTDI